MEPYTGTISEDRALRAADYAAALAAAFLAFLVYLKTLGPTVTGEDSGEFITAAYALGIPHPPGYPLWCLLAHVFTWLPCGAIAWRVNLSSAFFAAATVFLAALLVMRLTRSRLSALAASLALAFSHEFWEQAVVAEVYALNALLIALCIHLLWHWRNTRRDCWLCVFGLVYGLSLANHNTMVLLGPVFMGYVLWADGFQPSRWRIYSSVLLFALAGLLVYLYLPLASMADPPMDWGNPQTLRGLWDHATRKQLSFMYWQYPRSVERYLLQLWVCAGFWLREFGWPVTVAGLAGWCLLWRRRRADAVFTLAAAIAVVAGFALVQNFNFDKEWRGIMTVFGIPAYMMTALWLGETLAWLRARATLSIAVPAAAACVLVPLSLHWQGNDKSSYYWTEDYARNVLVSMAPDAVYIPDADHASFPAVYLQAVEGLRPDVLIARKYGYLAPEVLAEIPASERAAEWGEKPRRRYEPAIVEALLRHSSRPLYFAAPPKLPPGWRAHQSGLLFRVIRWDDPIPDEDPWAGYRWRNNLDPEQTRGDDTAELILYEYHLARAREAFRERREDEALYHVETGLSIYGREVQTLNNVGVLCAEFQRWDTAERYFREALLREPGRAEVEANLERLKTYLRGPLL